MKIYGFFRSFTFFSTFLTCFWKTCCSLKGTTVTLPVGKLTPALVTEIRQFYPMANEMAQRRLDRTIQAEIAFVQSRGGVEGERSQRRRSRPVNRFFGSSPSARQTSFFAFVTTNTLLIIQMRFGLNKKETEALIKILAEMPPMMPQQRVQMQSDQMSTVPPATMCPFPQMVGCDPNRRYRTIDGSCNNLQRPNWGMSMQPFSRLIHSDYGDGIRMPRRATAGSELPSARLVSFTVHRDIDAPSNMFTHMLMLMGQFIDHDLTRTAISTLATSGTTSNNDMGDVDCGADGCQTTQPEQANCFPISIPSNDTAFSGFPCLEFVRTLEVPNEKCAIGPREQLNQLTSWFDASQVYGSDMEDLDALREQSQTRGRLNSQVHPFNRELKNLLPASPDFDECQTNGTLVCFRAGDGRVNENVALMSLHTVFMREHNRIESALQKLNPHWDGSRLFEESRRILIAEWQHTVYNEYIPVILGPFIMQQFGLNLQTSGFYNGYNPGVDPDIRNAFATAAYRFGHSQIQSNLSLVNAWFQQVETVFLSTTFRNPTKLYDPNNQGYDFILRGMFTDPAQTVDNFITSQVSTLLFTENPPTLKSMDLISLNIQRGRDHGLPGYNHYREICGLGRVSNFDQLHGFIPDNIIHQYKSLYRCVDDIDLFSAGLSEFPAPGSVLGPTFSCIIAEQFANLRNGDRFWYENNANNPYPFTKEQLAQIRKSTYARIICNNGDFITHIQPRVLLQPFSNILSHIRATGNMDLVYRAYPLYHGNWNNLVPCDHLPDVDLRYWQEVSQYGKEAASSDKNSSASKKAPKKKNTIKITVKT